MAVGTIKTMESLGASFSNLIGESIADYMGYEISFLFLAFLGILPIWIYWRYTPDDIWSTKSVVGALNHSNGSDKITVDTTSC